MSTTFHFDTNVKIHYDVYGAGSSNVLMLHGFGASRETWNDILPLMEDDFTFFLVDLKGFGLSSKPKDRAYALRNQAAIIRALIDSIPIKNPRIVGHSYGGAIALLLALGVGGASTSNAITSLTLIDSPADFTPLPFFVSILRHPVVNWILPLVPSKFRARYVLKKLFYDPSLISTERVQRYARYFGLSGSNDALISAAMQIVPDDASGLLAKVREISYKTNIIWGANDPIMPLSHGKWLAENINGASLHVIPSCGHIPQEERPEETALRLSQCLA